VVVFVCPLFYALVGRGFVFFYCFVGRFDDEVVAGCVRLRPSISAAQFRLVGFFIFYCRYGVWFVLFACDFYRSMDI